MSRNYFGKLLSTNPSRPAVFTAHKNLVLILRSYVLMSIPVIAVGPTIAPLLLKIVAGAKWRDSGAGEVLASYCYYIPLLAINGLTEAFVASVATEAEIHLQTAWMLGFSAGFAGAAVFFLQVLDMGAAGLVWANALNMFLRIIWCTVFIRAYLKRYGTELDMRSLLPQPLSIASGVGTYAMMGQLAMTFSGGLGDVAKSGAIGVAFVGML
jgi:oligosaccharide translocation protein RFT1